MRLIDADALKFYEQLEPMGNGNYKSVLIVYKKDIEVAPTIGYPIEQIKWERDIAIEQLNTIGKGLGETMDDVQPVKTGEWLYNGSDGYNLFGEEFRWKKCSLCGYSYSTELSKSYNYCPNCGAKMEKEEE